MLFAPTGGRSVRDEALIVEEDRWTDVPFRRVLGRSATVHRVAGAPRRRASPARRRRRRGYATRVDHDFWRARWREARIGWHEAEGSALLRAHGAGLELGPGRRVLAPLAGKSHDLALLGETGAEVVGVELVETAAAAFFAEHGASPERAVEHGRPVLRAGGVSIVCGDFFAETPETLGHFDAVFDRAALVALPPEPRVRYAKAVRALAAPDAPMLLVTFEHDAADGQPPFSVELDEVDRLYPGAHRAELAVRDLFDPAAALAARGATYVRERGSLLRLS